MSVESGDGRIDVDNTPPAPVEDQRGSSDQAVSPNSSDRSTLFSFKVSPLWVVDAVTGMRDEREGDWGMTFQRPSRAPPVSGAPYWIEIKPYGRARPRGT